MDQKTLSGIALQADRCQTFEQMKHVVIDLALALSQINAEVSSRKEGTHAALLKYTAKERTSRGR